MRFLVKDDEQQAKLVYQLFKQAELNQTPFFIHTLVVLEVIWVLQSVYKISNDAVLDALKALLLMPVLVFENQSIIQKFATSNHPHSFDLADILIGQLATLSGCSHVLTFDKKAAKLDYFKLYSYRFPFVSLALNFI